MPKLTDELPARQESKKRHYWLREDFDHLISLLPGSDIPNPNHYNSSSSLQYPKHTEGAFRELRLRGLKCDEPMLQHLVERGICNPRRGHSLVTDDQGNVDYVPSIHIMFWEKEDIDAAAEWLYEHEYWGSWTHFCWVCNLRFGQCVKAHRVAAARYGVSVGLSFDPLGLATVIEPAEDPDDYAYVWFYPKGAKLEPQEVVK